MTKKRKRETHQAERLPRSNVVGKGNGAASALALAHADVLVERRRALDARGVGAGRLVDVIGTAIAGHCAQLLAGRARVVRAVRLDDVVLDQRGGGPAVQRDERVAGGVDASAVVDGAVCGGLKLVCDMRYKTAQ